MFKSGNRLSSFLCLQLVACSFWLSSCNTVDLYERVIPIPAHQWQSKLKPQFTFQIKDTTVPYQFYVILRHNNQYKYNNIWVNLLAKSLGDSVQKLSLELPLANKEGWLGTGMDDIFEHRIRIGPEAAKFSFLTPVADGFLFTHAGQYSFTLEQIMRDDPLTDVMDVGFRLEKKSQ